MTTRILTPGKGSFPITCSAFGRNYTASGPGVVQDVPDQDAQILGANGWQIIALVGTTAQRPNNPSMTPAMPFAGQEYVDTTLGAVIVFDGTTWRNAITGAAV